MLAAGSRDLQNLQKLPWERQGDYADMVQKLTAMAGALKAAVRPKKSGALSTQAISEMLQEGDEDELPKLWPNFASHCPNLHPREVSSTCYHVGAFSCPSSKMFILVFACFLLDKSTHGALNTYGYSPIVATRQ